MANPSFKVRDIDLGRPDPEVPEKARRRTYSASYKLDIVQAADGCSKPGEIGALLRREGLYSSLLSTWRRQRDTGALAGLSKKRGRKRRPVSAEARRVAELERENARLKHQLYKAETIIDVQKNFPGCWGSSRARASHERCGAAGRDGGGASSLRRLGGPQSHFLSPPSAAERRTAAIDAASTTAGIDAH